VAILWGNKEEKNKLVVGEESGNWREEINCF